jgi:S1-C subfamily serine protease
MEGMMRRSFFLLALLLLAAGCAGSPETAVQAADAPVVAHSGDGPNETFRIIADARAKVFPAVVFIKPVVEKYERGEKKAEQVAGSGVLISAEGEVVTNHHVVEKALRIRCMLSDGRYRDAEIVGSDKEVDLALIRLNRSGDETFPYATLASDDVLFEGDFVMAMGAPWGLNRSVSLGIISCVKRYIPDRSEYSNWIQTDASLNPGNSGGPLVNTRGEVIGINSLASSQGGDLGFAVPAATVRMAVEQFRAHGQMPRAWSGISVQPLRDFDQDMYFDAEEGVIVSGTSPDSPAQEAGLRNGDRIVRLNDTIVNAMTDVDLPEVRSALALLASGEPATVDVFRGDQPLKLTLTPRVKGSVEGDELDCPRWNMTVKSINQFDNPDLYFVRPEGVFVFGIKSPGNAQRSGLGRNDIITGIDGRPITTLDDVKRVYDEVLAATPRRTRVIVEVLRGAMTRQIVLDFATEYKAD